MSPDDANPDRQSPPLGETEVRERYFEKTIRGVTVATIEDRYNDEAWIRSTLTVRNEP